MLTSGRTNPLADSWMTQFLNDPDPARRPDVVSYDLYPFTQTWDSGSNSYVGDNQANYFFNLKKFREHAGERPLWTYIAATEMTNAGAIHIPDPTVGQLRYMVFTSLAYGVKGVVYFTYELPDNENGSPENFSNAIMNGCDGNPSTGKTATVSQINRHLAQVDGPIIMQSQYLHTFHESTVPTNETLDPSDLLSSQTGLVQDLPSTVCMVGVFRDSVDPTIAYLMVVNKHSSSPVVGQQLVLRGNHVNDLDASPSVDTYTSGMSWTPVTGTLVGSTTTFLCNLAAGEGRLFRVRNVPPGDFMQAGPLAETSGKTTIAASSSLEPRFSVFPNPSQGKTSVAFSFPSARHLSIGIYNVRGQQVKRLFYGGYEAGTRTLVWDGTSEAGAIVGPGIYFCRVESTVGESLSRAFVLTQP